MSPTVVLRMGEWIITQDAKFEKAEAGSVPNHCEAGEGGTLEKNTKQKCVVSLQSLIAQLV